MATSASEASEQPLTLVMLVGELEKLRKDVTGELTASMNTALAPIQASLQKITDTVATHTVTITGMETALSAHSDGITTLEREVAVLKSKLDSSNQVNDRLQLAVEDLVSRSKQQNLRVIGIPEGMEGDDARLFMTTLFKKMVGDPQLDTLELDRAHRSLAPKPPQGSRPLIGASINMPRRNVCCCGLGNPGMSRTKVIPSGSLKISAPHSPRSGPPLTK
ncbi:Outer capsid protein VP4 [Dissostichus eleginoides]|uniref:Outer capsid protein VP4 n=1 Tax=Dissostichus eleginoides TaxID=100907 RepID=A0AAD9BG48_DISEL|nr:Outer capsid protein VP4 [Dissostichus eleginoides]